MNKKLTNYFNWVDRYMEIRPRLDENFDLVKQSKYLKDSFNQLESLNWNIEAAAIVSRSSDRRRFPMFLDGEKANLISYINTGLGEKKELNEQMQVVHFLKYLSQFKERYMEIDDQELSNDELDFQSAVDGYLSWIANDYKSPDQSNSITFG